jgi:hypothetical protein
VLAIPDNVYEVQHRMGNPVKSAHDQAAAEAAAENAEKFKASPELYAAVARIMSQYEPVEDTPSDAGRHVASPGSPEPAKPEPGAAPRAAPTDSGDPMLGEAGEGPADDSPEPPREFFNGVA